MIYEIHIPNVFENLNLLLDYFCSLCILPTNSRKQLLVYDIWIWNNEFIQKFDNELFGKFFCRIGMINKKTFQMK